MLGIDSSYSFIGKHSKEIFSHKGVCLVCVHPTLSLELYQAYVDINKKVNRAA